MYICPICGENWKDVGHSYYRKKSNKVDYYCECGGKRKPVDNLVLHLLEDLDKNFL